MSAAEEAASALVDRAGRSPRIGIVLGSGLGAVADAVADPNVIGYEELPGFPLPTVAGHAGRAVIGDLGGVPVAVLQGRRHLYEGPPVEPIATPIRALRAAGAETLILTNAAGSLRPELGPGSLMAITDHINLTGANPLVGPNDDALGPRFPSLRDAYDPGLRAALHETARDLGTPLADGVYLAVSGRASRRPPRSAPSARSAPMPSGCRPSTRRSSPATPVSASRRSRRSPTSPRASRPSRSATSRRCATPRARPGAVRPPYPRSWGGFHGALDDLRRALAVVDLTRLERPDDAAGARRAGRQAVTGAGRVAAICG